jgi:hypothetical protein
MLGAAFKILADKDGALFKPACLSARLPCLPSLQAPLFFGVDVYQINMSRAIYFP